jgi:cation transport protein ChaC
MPARDDIWVFANGSLMWTPGFEYLEMRPALLRGYHRSFCIYSHYAWGTRERPGLVLGLLPGGSCRGRALRVAADRREAVLAYLDDRESAAYRRKLLSVAMPGGAAAAHTYVANREHEQYAGRLPLERAASLIRHGVGHRGSSRAYLQNTVRHLDESGIRDGALHTLLAAVEAAGGG